MELIITPIAHGLGKKRKYFMSRAYYSDLIEDFLARSPDEILGALTRSSPFAVETTQRNAWMEQVVVLKNTLRQDLDRGKVYFEYAVPRLGKRIDVLVLLDQVVFVLEFKVGETQFLSSAKDQVWDYAVDLKNFHETSHNKSIAPILIATGSTDGFSLIATSAINDGVLQPIQSASYQLRGVMDQVLQFCDGSSINPLVWDAGGYHPTPTIVEAAMALYGGHSVMDISRSDASAINLGRTTDAISEIIRVSQVESKKSICLVTGVPGAGKTLVGLNVATQHISKEAVDHAVFLSGNGPLVAILSEALARDKVRSEAEAGRRMKKGEAIREVKLFIQNVHHYRDECLIDTERPPLEHVAIFDEAQRAWNLEQTASFMLRKKQKADFSQSEPEFLISCLNRHKDWAVVVCLVGGGQEINTGEAGIEEWIDALQRSFPDWHIHISPRLHEAEYGAGRVLAQLMSQPNVHFNSDLHLEVSMRSFRAEHVSALVKNILDINTVEAQEILTELAERYPIVLTRSLAKAKAWLREQARGTERYGMVVSSQAQRLKPHAIDVKSPMDPIHWFLDGKEDVRSSYYLEDVATEFHVQGLELDWACVVWDADFRFSESGWKHYSFVGTKWQQIHKLERQGYLKNAYRVLLTRARQGMVLVVPQGTEEDPTRPPAYYDPTFNYLRSIGIREI
ncbi:DUF2075 domain-containing protein [Rhodoferax sp.]|uniref:DUF2075 domain-containing protein n=1 Tax=Rhodoferax sp. TaxID=50421 RepID=UPI0025D5AB74|nr:DUF2075 domain-containing protein [Rhodoferax sp.]MCM2340683.1 DUF2075 domain-containing protein [Rhodoferax sp.]